MVWQAPIIDRTSTDVANKTAKGYLNISDLIRIEQNCEYLAGQLAIYGYPVSITVKTDWGMEDFPFRASIDRIRDNVNALIDAFYRLPGTPDIRYWESIDYTDANSLEQNILNIDLMLKRMLAAMWRCGDIYGGEQ